MAEAAEKKSRFSIRATLSKKEEKQETNVEISDEDLPANHFTETDLLTEWEKFLADLRTKEPLIYNAIHNFSLNKEGENEIRIKYPSDSAKAEFEKVQSDFINHFKRKVNNFKISILFKNDATLKKEVVTKRKIFDKFAEINPVLKDLNQLLKFDLT